MITFVDYQYKGIGGVGQLVVNVVQELNRKGYSAKVYASSDSYEYQRLVHEEANCILIDSEKVGLDEFISFLDKEDVIFVTNLSNNILFNKIKKNNNRLLFYVVHPDTFFSYRKIFALFRFNQRSLELINALHQKKALYIMDRPNLEAIERKGLHLTEPVRYLPVPIRAELENRRDDGHVPSCHNITYIGRGNADWKIYPVIKVLQDLNKLKGDYKFTIFTEVDTRFRELIAKYVPNNVVKMEYVINIYGEDLDKYLKEKSWLHISMGTSALEGAKLRIPTILIDYSKSLFPENYVYKWLYEAEGYSLADELLPDTKINGTPLNEMIEELNIQLNYKKIANKCFDYVLENHSLSRFVDKILNFCEVTEMTMQDYCNSSLSHFFCKIYPSCQKINLFVFCIKHPCKTLKNRCRDIF